MKAMIFAAGRGTRLKPITNNIPKALVEINHTALIEILIKKLIKAGISDIVINVHHFANQIIEFLNNKQNFGVNISISDESDLLRDTGGGLKYAQELLLSDEPVLIHNVDVITDIDLYDFINIHKKSGALATLAVRKRNTKRYLLFDNEHTLCGWKNISTGEIIRARSPHKSLIPLAFSGIHIVQPNIFEYICEEGVFSIIKLYLRLAEKHLIKGYVHSDTFWDDIGKMQQLKEINANPPGFL